VKGSVTLKGDAPAPMRFKNFDDRAKALFPDGILHEPVAVDKEKHVRSALVYVKAGLEGRRFDVPKEPKTLDVEGFQLRPRMLGIMAGQDLVVTNKDDLLHAVHALPRAAGNKEFNTGLPGKGMSRNARFPTPEVAIKVVTEDHHDWELAWVAVLPHPCFAVTDEQGRYEIKGLPPGKYTLEAWQENCTPATQEIEVKANESKMVDFFVEAKRQPK
jgi:hypothetical protein